MGLNFKYYINQIYGVTRNPETNEYAIITQYQNGGNLRRLIVENQELSWKKVISMLCDVSSGLDNVHQRNYHHKDFHSGNILSSISEFRFRNEQSCE